MAMEGLSGTLSEDRDPSPDARATYRGLRTVVTHVIAPRGYELGYEHSLSPSFIGRYVQQCRMETMGYSFMHGVRLENSASWLPSRTEVEKHAPFVGVLWPRGADPNESHPVMVVSLELEMIGPASRVAPFYIETRVQRVGRSSLTMLHVLRQPQVSLGNFIPNSDRLCPPHALREVARVSVILVRLASPKGTSGRFLPDDTGNYDFEVSPMPHVTLPLLKHLPRVTPRIAPEACFVHAVRVRLSDLDMNSHVTNCRYIDYIEDARFEAARQGAYSSPEANENARKAAQSVSIDFAAEAFLEPLLVRTWNEDPRTLCFEISRENVTDSRPEICMRAIVKVDVAETVLQSSSVWEDKPVVAAGPGRTATTGFVPASRL